jgi:hypothetical protein
MCLKRAGVGAREYRLSGQQQEAWIFSYELSIMNLVDSSYLFKGLSLLSFSEFD